MLFFFFFFFFFGGGGGGGGLGRGAMDQRWELNTLVGAPSPQGPAVSTLTVGLGATAGRHVDVASGV